MKNEKILRNVKNRIEELQDEKEKYEKKLVQLKKSEKENQKEDKS